MVWILMGCAALVEFVLVALSFFRPKPRKSDVALSDKIIEAGAVDAFKPGSVTAFTRGFFYLVRLEDSGFLAFSSKCTHLGCTLPWVDKEKKFICPCHSSEFDIKGRVTGSPATRPLDLYPVKIENRTIFVDTAQITRRKRFDTDQVVYADVLETRNGGS